MTGQFRQKVLRLFIMLSLLGIGGLQTMQPVKAQEPLVVELMQTGRNDASSDVRDALVFRVRAYDPTVGKRDGNGIDHVELSITDSNGREVHFRRENTAGYCAFGGGEPNCNIYDFARNNNRWPNGDEIREGDFYILTATVFAKDGRQASFDWSIVIGGDDGNDDLEGEIMQTGRNSNSDEARDALVFRVRANDPRVGNRDGDGIDRVEMRVVDRNGRTVVSRRENNAGYCAFGGGEPNCNVYVFSRNNNRWPNGDRIRRGEEYTLRATIFSDDGRRMDLERTIVVR
jgi:hypothetical protein